MVPFKYLKDRIPTVILAINPAQNMPFMSKIREPIHASGTYKTSILKTEKKVDGKGLFIPLKLDELSTPSPCSP